ncbi:hypothetical protein [Brenneria alni]|uniref:hypothetical protein n=1 Tax=Brenneria alni TaxID=71656 RepID=UPI0011C461EB|nr:hypothetical protein [Brenneria alni]
MARRQHPLNIASPGKAGPRCRATHRASLCESRPCWASIVPSLRSADAYGPASSFGPARFACVRSSQGDGRCLSSHLS